MEGRLITYQPSREDDAWTRSDAARESARYGVVAADPPGEGANLSYGSGSRLHRLVSLGGRRYLAVREDGAVARLDAASICEAWRVDIGGIGRLREVSLDPQRGYLVALGQGAWRVLRLEDGLAVSGRLRPPAVLRGEEDLASSWLHDLPGSDGEVLATCDDETGFRWQPRVWEGDVVARLAQVVCIGDGPGSPVEQVRRCLAEP